MRKALWLAISLLVVVVLLVGGCAGHPKGMKSLRWLTDAEKERVIEIALNPGFPISNWVHRHLSMVK